VQDGAVQESEADLAALQRVLDDSQARAGAHLRSIFGEDTRVGAAELVALLPGMQVIDLATVSAAGEPRVAPVDGLFFRGRWHFGSSLTSVRAHHLAARPACSAAHTRGEGLCVITHGRAERVDFASRHGEAFLAHLREVYPTWDEWTTTDAPYWCLVPNRMYVRAPHAS
jgi:hypothetical protein